MNLMLLPLRNTMASFNSAQTRELPQSAAPDLATKRFDAAQTQALTPRTTMAERATTRLHEVMAVTKQQTRPYVSLMLTAAALVFITGMMLWRNVHAPAQNVAYAAVESTPAPLPTVIATPAPASPWVLIESETQAVTDATNALIEDQQCAVIEPNGQLALALKDDQFFGNGAGTDILIHGASAQQISYRIFVRDAENAVWQRIDVNRKGFVEGAAQHDMGHHGIVRARQVMIRNDSVCALQVDGIAAAYPNLEVTAHSHRH
ncbi:MAG: hypothetical protein HOP19_09265 [Acidobacteria bacterium]|nr:hypothetical protein [Acidobacteriota bacterium]